jgi:hypothetical protein
MRTAGVLDAEEAMREMTLRAADIFERDEVFETGAGRNLREKSLKGLFERAGLYSKIKLNKIE